MKRYCYYLRLGLWNVAEGLQYSIDQEPVDVEFKASVEKLLWNIALNSSRRSFFSPIIQTPWHQVWLATSLILQQKMSKTGGDNMSMAELNAQRKATEFQCTLHDISMTSLTPHMIVEELCHLFSKVLHADQVKEHVQCLSVESHSFLSTCLVNNIVSTNVLIQNLLCLWCPHFVDIDNELQDLYKDALGICLQRFEKAVHQISESTQHLYTCNELNVTSVLHQEREVETTSATLFSLLSLLQVSEEKKQNLIDWLSSHLLPLCDSGEISKQLVYLSLLSRSELKWLIAFSRTCDIKYNVNHCDSELFMCEKRINHLLDSNGMLQVEYLFQLVVKSEKHWIEHILNMCSECLINESTDTFFKCLSHPILKKVVPLIVLHFWSNSIDRNNMLTILSFLVKVCKEVDTDPVFHHLCEILEHQMLLLVWCKTHGQNATLEASEMLRLARECSTLDMLRRNTNLAEVEWVRVKEILQQNHTQEFCLHWDSVTFDGYCVLMRGFSVIQAAMEIEKLIIYRQCSIDPDSDNKKMLEVHKLYKERITHTLEEINKDVCDLFPLNFRIEILENLFSLLFLRHEDFQQEQISSDSDAEEEEGEAGDHSSVRSTASEMQLHSISSDSSERTLGKSLKMHTTSKPFDNLAVLQPSSENTSSILPLSVIEDQLSKPLSQNLLSVDCVSYISKRCDSQPVSTVTLSVISKNMLSNASNICELEQNLSISPPSKISQSISSSTQKLMNDLALLKQSQHNFIVSSFETRSSPLQFRRPRQCSDKNSSGSNVVPIVTNHGFVCNEYVVRDMLHCLKRCLVSTSASFYSVHACGDMDSICNCQIPSSVSMDSLQQRLNRLSQCVSEATWRLQLLIDTKILKEVGNLPWYHIFSTVDSSQINWLYPSENSESESEDDKEEHENSDISTRVSTRRMSLKRNKSETEKSSESGCQSTPTGVGSGSKSGHYRSRCTSSQSKQISCFSVSSDIVTHMLSSQSSLAVHCLAKGDLDKAEQVIQMCGMMDTPLAVDIKFSDSYQKLRTKLKICTEGSNRGTQEPHFLSKGIKQQHLQQKTFVNVTPTLQSIKQVATAGVHSTTLTSEVERFLSVTSLPDIEDANRVVIDYPQVASLIQCSSGIVLAIIDLALTVGTTYEHSVSLLDLACKHCANLNVVGLQGINSLETGTKWFPGCIPFIQNMIQLLKLANKECNVSVFNSVLARDSSLCDLLCCVHLPVSFKLIKDHIFFWNTLFASVKDYKDSMTLEKRTVTSEDTQEISVVNKPKEVSKAHIAFRKLMKVCSSPPLITDIMKSPTKITNTDKYGLQYLERLYAYLKLISAYIAQNLIPNTGCCSPLTFFDILNESLVNILGRLVFECNVSPVQLEPMTCMIRHNLVYSLVHNCSPSIPGRILSSHIYESFSKTMWGKIILNDSQMIWTGPVNHPELAVRSLLSDLLELLLKKTDGKTIEREEASVLAKDPSIKCLLEQTQQLAVLDLNLLMPGNESVAFYTNLLNLLWIHSLLVLETCILNEMHMNISETDDIDLDKNRNMPNSNKGFGLISQCPLERLINHKCVGYNVGKMGFLSIHYLQKHLLGKELTFPFEPSLMTVICAEEDEGEKCIFNCLSLSTDPRILFSLISGQKYSPRIQVLLGESMDAQLDNGMTEYLNHHVRINGHNQLVVPQLLHWYQEVVLLNQEQECSATLPALARPGSPNHFSSEKDSVEGHSKEKNTMLLEFLCDNTSGSLQIQLAEFTKMLLDTQSDRKSECVIIEHSSCEFLIKLNYSDTTYIHELKSFTTSKADLPGKTWKVNTLQEPVLNFLKSHCWLLSYIVHQIHSENSGSCIHDNFNRKLDERTKYLERLLEAKWVAVLKPLFQGNMTIAALNWKPDNDTLLSSLHRLFKECQWKCCIEILWALPETLLLCEPKFQRLNDIILFELASELPDNDRPSPWKYCQYIGDMSQQYECVLKNLPLWPGSVCEEALNTIMEDNSREMIDEVQQNLHKIHIYEKILQCYKSTNISSWYDVSCASENNPGLVLKQLIDAKEFQLCLQWADLHGISNRAQQLVDSKFLLLLLDPEPSDFTVAKKLLLSLIPQQAILTCDGLIQQLKTISCLKFIVSFLLEALSSALTSSQLTKYKLLLIGVEMVATMPPEDQLHFWDLIGQPQLIVEQLIMNTRLKMLEKILESVGPMLSSLPINSPVSVNSMDMMLRQYATKALDFRVRQTQAMCWANSTEGKLLVSLSMCSSYGEEFFMPDVVPTKLQWVPNDEVAECMCCGLVTFSMFNRRHHCRRCGRVICGSCSAKRMKVLGYGNVLVRVCDGCYGQTQQLFSGGVEAHSEPSEESTSTAGHVLFWRLTFDEAHNTTMREEFSFEHAPSVSLCLAILKLHSEQTAYPRFLLDSCDRILHLLQPVSPGTVNPEVDHSLVIRMVRSLVVAAKVKYARYGLNTGVTHCDQLLSQVDLLSMLVKSGCSALIPSESLNGHALRRLRDRLVEEEMWNLAMDVSTKGGLDRAGVWAAWGKACLQAGCWKEAREKFSHCLDRVTASSDMTRPSRNPPLLTEIVQILEIGAYTVDRKVLQQADKMRACKDSIAVNVSSSPALTILHTLASLKGITQGKYTQATPPSNTVIIGPKLDPLFYDECRYYLTTYGSHAGIVSFFLSHDDLTSALQHMLIQKVDEDIFLETIYIPCLKQGLVSNLHNELSVIDSSLEVWKSYLCHVCHHLERQGLLNVLYQLQLYMRDFVRAAMTCIRFYQSGARSYSDLATNVEYLQMAQTHLETELATINWGTTSGASLVRNVKNLLGASQVAMKLEPREVDRHINTIMRQVEVTKFLHMCETEKRPVLELVSELFQQCSGDTMGSVPTLFGTTYERVQLAVLGILCGKNVEEGFGIAFRIIQDYHLKALRVYSLAGKKLASDTRLTDIEQLVSCIQSSGMSDTNMVCDEVLALCVRVLSEKSDPGDIELLVKLIVDVGNKISAYIECRQLKSAYLLAVKYDRLGDVRRILREAERLGHTVIRKICLKRLNQH